MSAPTGAYSSQRPLVGPTGKTGTKVKGYKVGQVQNFDPMQMELYQRLHENVAPDSFTARLAAGDQSLFQDLERPALRQFGELQGNIASRFSGLGSGARRSSGFQNTMGQEGSNFAQTLQANRLNMRQQALRELMSMSGDLLAQKPYETTLTPKGPKGPSGFQKALPYIGGAVGGFFGGPQGALMGFQGGTALAGGGQSNFSGMSGLPTSWGGLGRSGGQFSSASANNSLNFANSFMPG